MEDSNMKRFVSILVAALVICSLCTALSAASTLPFVDVSGSSWYYSDVKSAVESGLVNGKTATTFCPDDYLTYAEAVKLAACMNQKYMYGAVSLENGTPWYQSYVDYAKSAGIIWGDYSWTDNATRAGYMGIFANALPDSALPLINSVPDGSIPDVPSSHQSASAIYKLYRAGILQGSDQAHNCKPNDPIKRSEVAAILTRMMDPNSRVTFSMTGGQQEVNTVTPPVNGVSQQAVSKAISYLNYTAFSYQGLIEQLQFEGFTYEQAKYGADNCGADWYEQAIKKAISYLNYTSFSYDGLVEQLEYEGFTHEQAIYGADNCGADWGGSTNLVIDKAKSYLKFTSFSYNGLIEQLQYEGFTYEQAKYGADNCGADWYEQAVLKAKSYLEFTSFSYTSLIEQLEYEGFTYDQAKYGVDNCGVNWNG